MSSRLIDQIPAPKTPPKMKVLLFRMPRTGTILEAYHRTTIAIRMAFEILHYWPFHGPLEARYLHTGKDYTRANYDKLFYGFNVSCNMTGTLVVADLIRAYPEAKVVVSTREVDRWLWSLRQSVDSAVSWKSFDWLAPWDPAYLDYYAWIQHAVPAERVLMLRRA
ncbi:uncharacterized protein BO95DRAFT_467623 [Aspergillus brunneoviolaceus CBS 621.78]|uniref:Uncharacterized protein n=1 Tax=Aspergillus brunneoviolaceus CBS 621.78 TaxID=1450534 RepID=A0ACD1FXQ2_9EURO|nr:hypothetical protein BO95DRAFT_467623 [Aspergillus brunneoviolaceus CBS 621.78]RAH41732.1 hypothetical protein BO95DRAFT_467623 [Aspergillus brunneoviolaceus CBS 621.78]